MVENRWRRPLTKFFKTFSMEGEPGGRVLTLFLRTKEGRKSAGFLRVLLQIPFSLSSFFISGRILDMALVKVSGLVTRYKILGKGKPILFLHGWGGSSESFFNLQKFLARHYRTIVLDLPGFGETDFPARAWRVEDYKNFVLAFAERLSSETFYLVGHSFGGRIAILLTALHPEKIEKLVLISSAGIKHEKSPEERAIGFVAKLGKRIISLPLVNRLEEPTRYLFYKLIRRQDYYLAKGVMKGTVMNVIKEDLAPYLSQISPSTLVIWGEKDEITPIEDAYTMKREIPHAKLEIIKGGSHYLPRKYPRELAYYINQFLK